MADFRLIHLKRIPDPTKGQAVWSMDFKGYVNLQAGLRLVVNGIKAPIGKLIAPATHLQGH